jgi:hypothetical protein
VSRDSLLDFRVRTTWKRGPAAESAGPFLISYTEFTPRTLRDLPALGLASERLRGACAELEGAVGVTTYWQLFRRRGGSVSVWEDEAALRRFVSFPYHVEIMRRYRPRGTVRATAWQADSFDLRAAFVEGQRALDAGRDRRR